MSGIVASCGQIDVAASEGMLSRLEHRGPDGKRGVVVSGNWIGARWRDHETSSPQPFTSLHGDLHMVADGEAYNLPELRRLADERPLSSSIDIVLSLYSKRGNDVFSMIDGPFAVVIAKEDGELVAARDPLGIRPLYWVRANDRVVFASELGAFDDDARADAEYFPPGHVWSSETGLFEFAEPFPSVEDVDRESDRETLLARVRDQLIESVESQMMGDTGVASFLSGGLDSSLIAAIGQRWMNERGKRLKTFAVGMEGSPDILAARQVAEYLDTEHHEMLYSQDDAMEIVPEVVRALESFDPSLVRSSVSNSILAKFTARYADIVLTGEGSDELFAGYEHLAEFDDDAALHAELINLLDGLHASGLQRVDRTAASNGLTIRLPFLSQDMVRVGMMIPASLKRIDDGEVEKRLLREAFEGWLPNEILWRTKAQFGDGSGAVDALQRAVSSDVTDEAFAAERFDIDPPIRTHEELAYYRMFCEHLGDARPEAVVERFATA